MIKLIRQVGSYSLLKRKNQYWIDNGKDDVSEYMDETDIYDLVNCNSSEFINKCLDLL